MGSLFTGALQALSGSPKGENLLYGWAACALSVPSVVPPSQEDKARFWEMALEPALGPKKKPIWATQMLVLL